MILYFVIKVIGDSPENKIKICLLEIFQLFCLQLILVFLTDDCSNSFLIEKTTRQNFAYHQFKIKETLT